MLLRISGALVGCQAFRRTNEQVGAQPVKMPCQGSLRLCLELPSGHGVEHKELQMWVLAPVL